jgi:hypothetical protein
VGRIYERAQHSIVGQELRHYSLDCFERLPLSLSPSLLLRGDLTAIAILKPLLVNSTPREELWRLHATALPQSVDVISEDTASHIGHAIQELAVNPAISRIVLGYINHGSENLGKPSVFPTWMSISSA